LGNNLAEFRKKIGFPQKSVAAELGVSQQAITKWETGKSLPRADRLMELAKLYGCTIDELLGGTGPPGVEARIEKGA
jgi:transcriptional regulator with XRE-family HTH domain